MSIVIRIISLSDSPRRETFHRPPEHFDVPWRFLDATRGLAEGITVDEKSCLRINGRILTKGELGCYSSHLFAWREMTEEHNISAMFVFEDDAYVDWNYISTVSKVDWSALGVDYIKLLVKYPAKFMTISRSSPIKDRHLVSYNSLSLGTVGYFITRKAAQRFVALADPISRPVDVFMDRPWATNVPVVGIVPASVIELSLPSTILGREIRDTSHVEISKIILYFEKIKEKIRIVLYLIKAIANVRRIKNRINRF